MDADEAAFLNGRVTFPRWLIVMMLRELQDARGEEWMIGFSERVCRVGQKPVSIGTKIGDGHG